MENGPGRAGRQAGQVSIRKRGTADGAGDRDLEGRARLHTPDGRRIFNVQEHEGRERELAPARDAELDAVVAIDEAARAEVEAQLTILQHDDPIARHSADELAQTAGLASSATSRGTPATTAWKCSGARETTLSRISTPSYMRPRMRSWTTLHGGRTCPGSHRGRTRRTQDCRGDRYAAVAHPRRMAPQARG